MGFSAKSGKIWEYVRGFPLNTFEIGDEKVLNASFSTKRGLNDNTTSNRHNGEEFEAALAQTFTTTTTTTPFEEDQDDDGYNRPFLLNKMATYNKGNGSSIKMKKDKSRSKEKKIGAVNKVGNLGSSKAFVQPMRVPRNQQQKPKIKKMISCNIQLNLLIL